MSLRLLTSVFLLGLFASCTHKLSVRTEYLTQASLASTYVATPDPRNQVPLIGQQLIISWRVPKQMVQDLKLDLKIRFRNQVEREHHFYCDRPVGTFVYAIQGEEFLELEGILTYQIFLWQGDAIIESWIHPLWEERIQFK